VETLAERLARLMLRDQLTQVGLARKAGVTPNNVQAMLTGHSKRPAADIVLPLSRALGVTPDYLVFGEEQPAANVGEARERLGDMFMELMSLLNALERESPALAERRVAETRAGYAGHEVGPRIEANRARLILERLRRRGLLRELAPDEPRLTLLIEVPASARQVPEIRELYE